MKRTLLQLSILFILGNILISCNQVDIKLINQIKTFGPRWSAMGEKLNFVDRNLSMMEGKFEKNYSELEPIFDQIPDTLRGDHLNGLLASYTDIVDIRDSLRGSYHEVKKEFVTYVETFNTWEKKVMDGDIPEAQASTELREFKENYHRLDAEIKQMEVELNFITKEHNRVFNGLTGALDVPTKYEVRLK